MKPEDQLIDALLKEQSRHRDADEDLLAAIDKALDDDDGRKTRGAAWWRRALPLSLAAGFAIGGAVIYQRFHDDTPTEAIGMGPAPAEPTITGVPAEPLPGRGVLPAPAPRLTPPGAPDTDAADAAPGDVAASAEMAAMAVPAAEPVPAPASQLKEVHEAPDVGGLPMTGLQARPKPARVARPETERVLRKDEMLQMNGSLANLDKGMGGGGGAALREEAELARSRAFGIPAGPADGRAAPRPMPELSRDNYGQLVDQPWKSPWQDPQSTFSIDVDNASYTNLRRTIREGRVVQPDAVRIEELVNYFDYRYPAPEGDSPFAVTSLLATCPWQPEHLLARVAIKGREIENNARPISNLVFLIDVSGSMQSPDKLPMLKRAMTTLVGSLDERDHVGIVVYAGTEGVVLPPTALTEEGKSAALRAIGKLESGGSTNGGAGLSRAYEMALRQRVEGGVNRVILATDGDFNVGTTGQGQLVELVKGNAAKGVSLSVLGFGSGNLNDSMLEAITNDGDGNYFYIDGDQEAGRIFQQKLAGTLVTIAKDVKIQVEFNPGKVKAYRLIGYANRVLRNEDFNNDKVDAGDIGAGHTVTAFYEIVPVGVASPEVGDVDELKYQRPADRRELVESDDWLTLKLRYKHPEGDKSRLIQTPVTGEPTGWEQAGADYRMAAAVALFGMKLRGMEDVADIGWNTVAEIARPALEDDRDERRAEFIELLKELK